MKKLLTFLSILILATAPAVNAADNIAIVDVEKIVQESKAAKHLREQLDKRKDKIKSELKNKEKELEKDKKKLEKQKSVLSEDAFKKKITTFREKLMSINTNLKERTDKLESSFLKALKKIDKVTMEIVGNIARKEKITIVLPKNKVLFYKGGNDITDAVLERLNKKLTKVDLD